MIKIVVFIFISFCVFYGTGKLVSHLLNSEEDQRNIKENIA